MQARYKELLQARVGALGDLLARGTMLRLLLNYYQVIHAYCFTTGQGSRIFWV